MVQIYDMESEDELIPEPVDDSNQFPESALAVNDSPGAGVRMTPKMPPTFDGQSSFFEFEDLIDDWLGITTLQPERHGPSLKNALVGSEQFYKNMLGNELARDPANGVTDFIQTIRPYLVKGTNHVFLWRILQFFRTYRGQMEIVHWIGRFEVTLRRLRLAWVDLLDLTIIPPVDDPNFPNAITPELRAVIAGQEGREAQVRRATEIREALLDTMRTDHGNRFPFNDTT